MVEGNVEICLICRKPIEDGEAMKKLNRGGTRGVRHAKCGESAATVPYIVDRTDDMEELAAVRNEDLFPPSGRKRAARVVIEEDDSETQPSTSVLSVESSVILPIENPKDPRGKNKRIRT